MNRRSFCAGLLLVPPLAIVRPDTLPVRRASFAENTTQVLMTVSVPALVRRNDKETLESIDSGFDMTFEYQIRLWQHMPRKKVASRRVVIKLRWNPWKKHYVVSRDYGEQPRTRTFTNRSSAIDAATTLERLDLCSPGELKRGAGEATYFVSVLALRNPLSPVAIDEQSDVPSGGRDVEFFGRLVQILVGERAQAEQVVHLRTNHFFLQQR